MASATSSSQRDWGKVRWPRTLVPSLPCTHPPCPARTDLALPSVSGRTGHGVRGAYQGVHHCPVQPLRTHPGDSCGHHVEVQSPGTPGLPGLWGWANRYWPPRDPCAWARTTLGAGGRAGLQASSFHGMAQTWGVWASGSRNGCDAFGRKVRPLALEVRARRVGLTFSVAASPKGAVHFLVVLIGQRVGGPSTSRGGHPWPEQRWGLLTGPGWGI